MKRAVTAIDLTDVVPGAPPTAQPVLTWVKPGELLVDEEYQRSLSDKSLKLIRRIVEGWDWRRFKPPIVAMTADGFEVLDGQHSATAAVCHPDIDEIPVVIVDAAEQQDRASAFIGHNRDRIAVTAAQMQVAAVAAGDKDALAVESACRLAEIRLLRNPPSSGKYQPRDTIAAAQIGLMVKKRGIAKSAEILTVLALAEFAPIQASHIKAVEHVLVDEDNPTRPEDLTRAIMALGMGPSEKDAKVFSATHNVPLWRGLASVWFQATKKARGRKSDPKPAADENRAAEPTRPVEAAPSRKAEREAPAPNVMQALRLGADVAVDVAAVSKIVKPDGRSERGGYVPGPLMKRCSTCDRSYVGGLKASQCADCAYGRKASAA